MHSAQARILVVDDAQSVRESLSWLLEDQPGLTVVGQASNGLDAINEAIRLSPDLVILDIELPDTDGFAVTRKLKTLPHPPLVILLSVHGEAVFKERGVEAGCDAYVEKGAGWPALLSVLQSMLKNKPPVV